MVSPAVTVKMRSVRSRFGEPRRRHAVYAAGALGGLDRAARGFDLDRSTCDRLVGGKAVEIDLEIFAADDSYDFERLEIGLAARQRACRDGRLFAVVMAFMGKCGRDRAAQNCGHRESTQGAPEMG